MPYRTSRAIALCLVSLVAFATACDDDSERRSASVQVSALATSSTTLEGPRRSRVVIPAGATDEDVTIVLSTPRTRRPGPASTTTVSDTFVLEPEGKTFLAPVELTIPITPSSLPAGKTAEDVIVLRAPQGTGPDAFVPLPTRREGNAVVAQTEHFSDFIAVVVDDGATPFGACGDSMCAMAESCELCPFDCGLCLHSADTTAPLHTGFSSPAVTTDVRGDVAIVAGFDEPLLAASVNATTVLLADGASQAIAGTIGLNGAVVTFTPAAPLLASTTYTATIVGVRDLAGNLQTTPATLTFTTGASVAFGSTSPVDASTGVLQSASIVLTYAAAIAPASFTVQSDDGPCTDTLQASDDGFATCVGGTLAVTNADSVVTLVPSLPLIGNHTYAVRVAGGARDARGFGLAGSAAFSFTVEVDLVPPQLVGTLPDFGGGDLLPDSTITFVFDEAIDPATVNDSTIGFSYGESSSLSGTFTVVGANVIFTPDDTLPYGESVDVDIENVADRSGNLLAAPWSSSFQVLSRPGVVSHVPPGSVGVHPRADLELEFDRPIVTGLLSMQTGDTPLASCTGTVQVMDDTHCFGGTVTVLSSTRIVIRVTSDLPHLASVGITIFPPVASVDGVEFDGNTVRAFVVSPFDSFAYAIQSTFSASAAFYGDLAGLDATCAGTAGAGSKAFVITSGRYPCSIAYCGLDLAPTPPTTDVHDWVLDVGTTYVNAAGQLLFTTDAAAPVIYPVALANSVDGQSGAFYWGGDDTWQRDSMSRTCSDFTDGNAGSQATFGTLDAIDATWLGAPANSCNTYASFLCVEPTPVTPYPIH